MAIDSHLHVYEELGINVDRKVFEINTDRKLEAVINVGLDLDSSIQAIKLADKYEKFYAAVGVHPLYANGHNCNKLLDLASNDKVVAIGEIGLDSEMNNLLYQKAYLICQIRKANELGLPVIIHANNTNEEVIDTFKRYQKPEYGCVFHCFQPDMKTFDYLMENDYYISFAGKVTYPNAEKSLEIARLVANDRFLIETDYPYIPSYNQILKIKRDGNLQDISYVLAREKGLSQNEIESLAAQNTKRLFKRIK